MHFCHCKVSMIEESLGDTMFRSLGCSLFFIFGLLIVQIYLNISFNILGSSLGTLFLIL
jgi:hypothetical protein